MIKNILIAILLFCFGIGLAMIALLLLAKSSIRFDHPILNAVGVHKPEIVGFLPYWLLDKADKEYAPFLTTLTYFGLSLAADGHAVKLVNAKEEEPGWTNLKSNKLATRLADARKNNIKTSLLVISGDDEVIGQMIDHPLESAQNLMIDVAPIMRDYGFTDLNLDIETFMEASESARVNFTAFVAAIKREIMREKLGTVSLDLIPISLMKEQLYDAKALGAIADRVILMTYDYHYLGGFLTGAVAPVGGAGETIEFDVETAVREAVKVIPKEKILLGIPLYGYEWETLSAAPGAATIPGGASTASTRRIQEILENCATCSARFDSVARQPYLIYPENDYFNQIYYEDEVSMKEKIFLAQRYQLGGVALWALGYEDSSILRPLELYKKSFSVQ